MTIVLQGKIRGRTVELTEDARLAEGEDVQVMLRTCEKSMNAKPGEGFLRTEGALADDPYWDNITEKVHAERRVLIV